MGLTTDENNALYKIADSLMVNIDVKNGDVSGSAKVVMETSIKGLKLPFTFTAKKMFSYGETGVLFHIAGNLNVLVAFTPKTSVQTAFVVDAAKCIDGGVVVPSEKLVSRKASLSEAVHNLGDAIVASFYRKTSGTWRPLTLAK